MKKQGLFFTMISVGMMTLIILVVTPLLASTESSDAEKFRLLVLDNFIQEVESSFFGFSLQVAGVRAINATIVEMDAQNSLMTDVYSEIPLVIIDGQADIGGGGLRSIMDNNTLRNFTTSLTQVAKDAHNMDLQIGIDEVRVRQFSPWEINIWGNFSLIAYTPFGNWSRTHVVAQRDVSIEGFLDPQYLFFEDVHRPIHRSLLLPQNWTIEELDTFIIAGNYTHFNNASAPSFLEMFNTNPTPSTCCGIESVLNPDVIGVAERNYADYVYWADSVPCSNLFVVDTAFLPSITNELKLSLVHAVLYNVTEHITNYTGCP